MEGQRKPIKPELQLRTVSIFCLVMGAWRRGSQRLLQDREKGGGIEIRQDETGSRADKVRRFGTHSDEGDT